MQVNLFNRSNRDITDHVRGTMISVPKRGHTVTTRKKAEAMCELYEELSLSSTEEYSEADFKAMEGLTKADLQKACGLMMRGLRVNFEKEFLAEVESTQGDAPPAPPAGDKSKGKGGVPDGPQ